MQGLLQRNKNIIVDEEVGKVLECFGVEEQYLKISPKEQDMGNDNSLPSNKSTVIQHEFSDEIGDLLVINKSNCLSKKNLSKLKHKFKNDEILTLPDEKLDIAFCELSREIIKKDYTDGEGLPLGFINKMKRRIDFIVETRDTKLKKIASDDFHRTFMDQGLNCKMTDEQRQEVIKYIIGKNCVDLLKKCFSQSFHNDKAKNHIATIYNFYSFPFEELTGKPLEIWMLYAIKENQMHTAMYFTKLAYECQKLHITASISHETNVLFSLRKAIEKNNKKRGYSTH